MHIGGDKGRSFVKIGVYSICLAKAVFIVHALQRQYLLCMPCEGRFCFLVLGFSSRFRYTFTHSSGTSGNLMCKLKGGVKCCILYC